MKDVLDTQVGLLPPTEAMRKIRTPVQQQEKQEEEAQIQKAEFPTKMPSQWVAVPLVLLLAQTVLVKSLSFSRLDHVGPAL